jgi:hypothetical protein
MIFLFKLGFVRHTAIKQPSKTEASDFLMQFSFLNMAANAIKRYDRIIKNQQQKYNF